MGHNPNPLLHEMMERAYDILRSVFHIPCARQVVFYINTFKMFLVWSPWSLALSICGTFRGCITPQQLSQTYLPRAVWPSHPPLGAALCQRHHDNMKCQHLQYLSLARVRPQSQFSLVLFVTCRLFLFFSFSAIYFALNVLHEYIYTKYIFPEPYWDYTHSVCMYLVMVHRCYLLHISVFSWS